MVPNLLLLTSVPYMSFGVFIMSCSSLEEAGRSYTRPCKSCSTIKGIYGHCISISDKGRLFAWHTMIPFVVSFTCKISDPEIALASIKPNV